MQLLTQASLYFSNPHVLALILIAGFLWCRPAPYLRILWVLLFTLILNKVLQSVYQVPFLPTVDHRGWGFPSGHMQAATVFWAAAAWEYRKPWFYGIAALILTSVGISLVQHGYHSQSDVFAALEFGLGTVMIYYLSQIALRKQSHQSLASLGLYMAILSAIIFPFVSLNHPFLWAIMGVLIGFPLSLLASSSILANHYPTPKERLYRTGLVVIGLVVFYPFEHYGLSQLHPLTYQFLRTLLISAYIGGFVPVMTQKRRKGL